MPWKCQRLVLTVPPWLLCPRRGPSSPCTMVCSTDSGLLSGVCLGGDGKGTKYGTNQEVTEEQ